MTLGEPRWQFFIDRGGTFTDCLGRDPHTGKLHVAKVLSSDRAPLIGIRRLLQLPDDAPIPPCDLRMGTTVATNALLERRGAACLLLITRGFADLLEIGDQTRPRLFQLDIHKNPPLAREVLETAARHDARGRVLAGADLDSLRPELATIRKRCASVAVAVMFAHKSPTLERELGVLCHELGFEHVALSHEVAPELGFLARADTSVLDAYLTPLIKNYVATLERELVGSQLRIMQSSGGLIDAGRFRGPNAILSGPAGGVVAVASIARKLALGAVIGFDMGGTSSDVSRCDGTIAHVYESDVAGVRVRAPMVDIHTVAAGGGSVCRFDGHRFSVGPDSASSDPGPLCYGNPRANALTLTDVNLALGRLVPDRFPFPLDELRPARALRALAEELATRGEARSEQQIAEGLFQIANLNMAEAIKKISVARGHDIRDHALLVFGGAGGQHACAIARRLGINRIVFHPYAGVLSAYGMSLADVSWHGQRHAGEQLCSAALDALEPQFRELEAQGVRVLEDEGFDDHHRRFVRRVDLRYQSTETPVTLRLDSAQRLREQFDAQHQRAYGYHRPEHPLEILQIRLEAIGVSDDSFAHVASAAGSGKPTRHTRLWWNDGWLTDVPLYRREDLPAGRALQAPALILEDTGVIVLEPGFEARLIAGGVLELSSIASALVSTRGPTSEAPLRADPVLLEIMGNLFMSIAEQMGHALRRTAISTNIRERLDFSCAVFDSDANLVANAPHIPVHLGAMGETIRGVLSLHPEPEPGDVYISNDPALGGSHLPDITVVRPVHDAGGRLRFFTASRGHHADIGGITPGSMPAFSQRIEQEGVVFRALRGVHRGQLDRELLRSTLAAGPYPARDPATNIADLEAQIAATQTGANLLLELAARLGQADVSAYMRFVQEFAAQRVREEIAKIPDGEHRFRDALDDGTPVEVCLRVQGDQLEIDFAGSGAEHAQNLNAPRAVTIAAVIYVLRSLVAQEIPLNSGCLEPVNIRVPQRSLLDPSPGRAVAGGNVETSQRVVDVLLGALGVAAASQGTMNNLSFGNSGFGYYETIGGGAGATPGRAGASAVHTHMTNTRITDPEVLESRYPARLLEFSLRRGSGGSGQYPGGDGIVRRFQFLERVQVSLLTQRRLRAPFGLRGGADGARGENLLDGRALPGSASFSAAPGQILTVKTPGGGGYGA